MKVVPSIDISGGNAVKRIRGKDGTGLVIGNPEVVARGLRSEGYTSLHIVDLDAAEGKGDNISLIERVIRLGFNEVSVGGGVRNRNRLEKLLSMGVTKVVMSTLPFSDPDLFKEVIRDVEDRVLISIDYCDKEVLIRGWSETVLNVDNAVKLVNNFQVRGVIFTYVCNEGTRRGIDPGVRDYVKEVRGERGYAGGIGSVQDLIELNSMGFDFA